MCWHKWTKWEQYIETGEKIRTYAGVVVAKYNYSEEREQRKCEKCGTKQSRLVNRLDCY
jgi:hypothetical protein